MKLHWLKLLRTVKIQMNTRIIQVQATRRCNTLLLCLFFFFCYLDMEKIQDLTILELDNAHPPLSGISLSFYSSKRGLQFCCRLGTLALSCLVAAWWFSGLLMQNLLKILSLDCPGSPGDDRSQLVKILSLDCPGLPRWWPRPTGPLFSSSRAKWWAQWAQALPR